MNRVGLLLMISGTLLLTRASNAWAQLVVQVDPPANTTRVASPPSSRATVDSVAPGTYRLRRPTSVNLQVVNTNTALYTMSTDDDPAPPPPVLAPIGEFLPLLKSYLAELAFVVPRGRGPGGQRRTLLPSAAPAAGSSFAATVAATALETARVVEENLHTVDSLVHGPRGIDGTLGLTLRTLDRMRSAGVEEQADALADTLGVPHQSCEARAGDRKARGAQSLNLSQDLLAALQTLQASNSSLTTVLSDTVFATVPALISFARPLHLLRARADTALHDSDGIVTAAYRVDEAARIVVAACSHWDAPPVKVTTAGGRIVTVHMQPRPEAEFQRVAGQTAYTTKVTLLAPLSRMGASIGASVLFVPRAQFHKYGVRPTEDSGSPNEIYEAESVDNRFSYGVTLGFTWSQWLDWRDSRQVALWVPELTLAEADGGPKVFGLGVAMSYRSIKLGVGGMLIRHQKLDGLSVAEIVPNDQFLKTRVTYGKPLPYVSLSVFNLMDLLSGKSGSSDDEKPPSK
jgi:hypothetical protein